MNKNDGEEQTVPRGRKCHSFYQWLNFINKKLANGRTAAQCTVCGVLLKNTSISRLQTHRNRCYPNYSTSLDDSATSNNVVYDEHKSNNSEDENKLDKVEINNENLSVVKDENKVEELEEHSYNTPTRNEDIEEVYVYGFDTNGHDNMHLEESQQPYKIIEIESQTQLEYMIRNTESAMVVDQEHDLDSNYYNLGTSSKKRDKNNSSIFNTPKIETSTSGVYGTVSSALSTSTFLTRRPCGVMEESRKFETPAKKIKRDSSKLKQCIDTMPPRNKNEIDLALSKFFFSCHIPLSIIDSDHFKNFIKAIRPSYIPPSRQHLSTIFLRNVSPEILKANEKCLLKNTSDIDGCKNSSNTENVVTMLQAIGGRSMFLESYNFSNARETGEALVEICEKSVQLAKNQYGCEIYAVVSDNVANTIETDRLTDLWHCTCSSHTVNLLTKDIINLDIIAKLITVLQEFKHGDLENALVKNGGSRITLPAETTGCSHRDLCDCFLKNLPTMKKIMAEGCIKIKAEVTHLLYDDGFVRAINNMMLFLNPICELINKCQKVEFSIADATEEWLDLHNKIPKDLCTNEVRLSITHHINMATNIYSFAANYLHPRYRGNKLSNEQRGFVQEFLLDQLDSEGLDGLYAFEWSRDIFEKLFEKKVTSCSTFWGLSERKFSTLAALAQKLLNIPASTAQLERILPNQPTIQSTLKKCPEKPSKLIFVYYSLKSQLKLRDLNRSSEY